MPPGLEAALPRKRPASDVDDLAPSESIAKRGKRGDHSAIARESDNEPTSSAFLETRIPASFGARPVRPLPARRMQDSASSLIGGPAKTTPTAATPASATTHSTQPSITNAQHSLAVGQNAADISTSIKTIRANPSTAHENSHNHERAAADAIASTQARHESENVLSEASPGERSATVRPQAKRPISTSQREQNHVSQDHVVHGRIEKHPQTSSHSGQHSRTNRDGPKQKQQKHAIARLKDDAERDKNQTHETYPALDREDAVTEQDEKADEVEQEAFNEDAGAKLQPVQNKKANAVEEAKANQAKADETIENQRSKIASLIREVDWQKKIIDQQSKSEKAKNEEISRFSRDLVGLKDTLNALQADRELLSKEILQLQESTPSAIPSMETDLHEKVQALQTEVAQLRTDVALQNQANDRLASENEDLAKRVSVGFSALTEQVAELSDVQKSRDADLMDVDEEPPSEFPDSALGSSVASDALDTMDTDPEVFPDRPQHVQQSNNPFIADNATPSHAFVAHSIEQPLAPRQCSRVTEPLLDTCMEHEQYPYGDAEPQIQSWKRKNRLSSKRRKQVRRRDEQKQNSTRAGAPSPEPKFHPRRGGQTPYNTNQGTRSGSYADQAPWSNRQVMPHESRGHRLNGAQSGGRQRPVTPTAATFRDINSRGRRHQRDRSPEDGYTGDYEDDRYNDRDRGGHGNRRTQGYGDTERGVSSAGYSLHGNYGAKFSRDDDDYRAGSVHYYPTAPKSPHGYDNRAGGNRLGSLAVGPNTGAARKQKRQHTVAYPFTAPSNQNNLQAATTRAVPPRSFAAVTLQDSLNSIINQSSGSNSRRHRANAGRGGDRWEPSAEDDFYAASRHVQSDYRAETKGWNGVGKGKGPAFN